MLKAVQFVTTFYWDLQVTFLHIAVAAARYHDSTAPYWLQNTLHGIIWVKVSMLFLILICFDSSQTPTSTTTGTASTTINNKIISKQINDYQKQYSLWIVLINVQLLWAILSQNIFFLEKHVDITFASNHVMIRLKTFLKYQNHHK